jgi:hypothetical protein
MEAEMRRYERPFYKMQKSMGKREVIYGTHVTKDTERGWRSEAIA